MEFLKFSKKPAGFEAEAKDFKKVYPTVGTILREGSYLCYLKPKGNFYVAYPAHPDPEWSDSIIKSKAAVTVLENLNNLYQEHFKNIQLPPLPVGEIKEVKVYSGGQGWDGLHGDTASDGGDYYTERQLLVNPESFGDYNQQCDRIFEDINIKLASVIAKAKLVIEEANSFYRKLGNLDAEYNEWNHTYINWYRHSGGITNLFVRSPIDQYLQSNSLYHRDGVYIKGIKRINKF